MSLVDKINSDIKDAMRAKDKDTLAALRDIKAKLLLEQTKEGGDGNIAENVEMQLLNKLYKQRVDAAVIYKEQGREDLYSDEMVQAKVIKAYLPEAMSAEELEKVVNQIVADTGASSMADMGKVMGIASKQLAGKADGKAISDIVKASLMK